ncbi:hypothetical protein RRG08_056864, partial [Elysia crispata]
ACLRDATLYTPTLSMSGKRVPPSPPPPPLGVISGCKMLIVHNWLPSGGRMAGVVPSFLAYITDSPFIHSRSIELRDRSRALIRIRKDLELAIPRCSSARILVFCLASFFFLSLCVFEYYLPTVPRFFVCSLQTSETIEMCFCLGSVDLLERTPEMIQYMDFGMMSCQRLGYVSSSPTLNELRFTHHGSATLTIS